MALYQQCGSHDQDLQGVCSILYGYCYHFFFFLLLFSSCVDEAKDSTEPAEVTRAEDDQHLITVPLNNQSEPAGF